MDRLTYTLAAIIGQGVVTVRQIMSLKAISAIGPCTIKECLLELNKESEGFKLSEASVGAERRNLKTLKELGLVKFNKVVENGHVVLKVSLTPRGQEIIDVFQCSINLLSLLHKNSVYRLEHIAIIHVLLKYPQGRDSDQIRALTGLNLNYVFRQMQTKRILRKIDKVHRDKKLYNLYQMCEGIEEIADCVKAFEAFPTLERGAA